MNLKSCFFMISLVMCVNSFAQVNDTILMENKVNNEWQNSGRDIISYTSSCSIQHEISQQWDAASASWTPNQQVFYTYDNSGTLRQVIVQNWDGVFNKWINYSKQVLNYSNNKKNQSSVQQQWDPSNNIWVNNFRTLNQLNDIGNTVVSEFDFYTDNTWLPSSRTFIGYDDNNRPEKINSQVWQTNSWIESSKNNYTYVNDKGSGTAYFWNTNTQQWDPLNRELDDYLNATNYVEKNITQFYSGTSWQNSSRLQNKYNSAGLQTTFINQLWDANTSSWTKFLRASLSYYPDKAIHQYTLEIWDPALQEWNGGYRSTLTNNGCNLMAQFTEAGAMAANVPGQKSSNAEHTYDIKNAGKLVYWFTVNSNSRATHQKSCSIQLVLLPGMNRTNAVAGNNINFKATDINKIRIFPNPAQNYFTINIGNNHSNGVLLKITDALGKQVMQQQVQTNEQRINISSLQKGVYFVTVIAADVIQKKKLVID